MIFMIKVIKMVSFFLDKKIVSHLVFVITIYCLSYIVVYVMVYENNVFKGC